MSLPRRALALKAHTVARRDGAMYRELRKNQSLPLDQLDSLQRRRGAAMATHAWDETVFYREYYSGFGLTRGDIADPDAFYELPVVEKSHLREASARFRARSATPRNSKMASTGGSTGEPVRLLHDTRVPVRTISWRLFDWWGVSAADNVAHVYRHVRSPGREVLHKIQWWPSRSIQIDAYRMDGPALRRFIAGWNRFGPALVLGYVGGIYELAQHIADHDIKVSQPIAVGVTAAPLSDHQRSLMSRVFGAPVFDHYRCGEIPWIAGECRSHAGLHTFGDVRLVEVVDQLGRRLPPGVMGDTVVTDLTNRVFPLVRYRIGDRSKMVAGDCPCGVTLPRIEHVRGRVSDALHLPDGQVIAGEGLTAIFDDWPESVRAFQVVQHRNGHISLRCVRGTDPKADSVMENVRCEVASMTMGKIPVALEIVEHIPHDGGKTRYIVSEFGKD